MYKCDQCGEITQPHEALKKIVTKKRNREYYITILKHRRNNTKIIVYHKPTYEELNSWKNENFEIIGERTTKGWEIEKEEKLCNKCNNTYLATQTNKII